MVFGDDGTPILEIVLPPEFHLLIGPVNTLHEALRKVWSEYKTWLSSCNVKRMEYHGRSVAGKDSRKQLKCTSVLHETRPKEFKNDVDTFNSFYEVGTACYGRKHDKDYGRKIDEFTKKYLNLHKC